MTFTEKIEYLEKDLLAKGEMKNSISPPMYRLAWKLRWELPPPLFGGFIENIMISGGFFGVVWGFAMWFLMWPGDMSIHVALVISALAGLAFGITMAIIWRRKNRKFSLGKWEDYPFAKNDMSEVMVKTAELEKGST